MCSRIMLAVHLKRTGENEWRSHPYVTQRGLSELPIPEPVPGSQVWIQAKAIAERVGCRREGASPGDAGDIEIECLVAGLYGLDSADLAWAMRVLSEAQNLEGVTTLRLSTSQRVTPLVVA